jgi:hypothetical protein
MHFTRKYSSINTWGSWITKRRYHAIYSLRKVENVTGRNPLNRQFGVVLGELRTLHEFDLIADIEMEIEEYNERVAKNNERYEEYQSFKYQINKGHFNNGLRKAMNDKGVSLREAFEYGDFTLDGALGYVRSLTSK